MKLGELQGSREYSEEDRRWLCSVFGVRLDVTIVIARTHAVASKLWVLVHWYAMIRLDMVSLSCGLLSIYGLTWFHLLDTGRVAQGTCVIGAGIDEDTWWFTGDTAEWLGCSLPLVGQLGLASDCVPNVVGFRGCLRQQRRCGGILWNDTAPLVSAQPAEERPPPEPPPICSRS